MNMINVLYADPTTQTLETELLGVPVQVRAIPIQYHWDLGDGNTITTKKPGKPYPSEQVTATYTQEGWYDITLTTTFAGQFSVDGGEWQDIDGTIEIASDPVPLFSKSLESRLVTQEGWYDITLTTTFAGQFSVDGGEWQDIDGTIEIASDPVPLFSKSLESRLVNPDIPIDEEGDPWIPARTPDAEGHRDPAATHREL
ncbi:hypothetical protein D641_0106235 [Brachybacterium muris UCD-AY4]|uniref:PKD domain-containing protein n=2 Tax=Brachybacterium TaxID=43668 RepID=A0A022KZ55_9MICO|nr:hypothetical protein D641_0106235 [Brachybacterium muris UCD-AY4]